jgi:hypothetical protein
MRFVLASALLLHALAGAAATPPWIERSNENARYLLAVQSIFDPEVMAAFGVEGLDEKVSTLPLDRSAQETRAFNAAIAELERRLAAERDPAVRQDLEILIDGARRVVEDLRLQEKYFLPVLNPAQTVFQGIQSLLDDRVLKERHGAALVRLRKYAGAEPGTTPLAVQAAALLRARLQDPGLLEPFRDDLERQLNNSSRFTEGIAGLFRKYGLTGWEEPLARLKEQLAAYDALLRAEVLPRARTDFRLPEEVYRFRLRQRGIDMSVEEMTSRAKTSFREIQNEMQTVAALVAKERKLPSSDYRDVIRALKREQLVGEAILPHYQARIADLERLIREGKVVTLPRRPMRVRIATEAESAAVPMAQARPPRFLGNTGESTDFILPLRIPGQGGQGEADFDDFTFEAASWTLTAHEGRPGHELQFAALVENGVPIARVAYAFNSVNVEGWALYAEAEMKPLLPLDGQLIALQHRLLRAARAFLDPGLQTGAISREEAFRVLEEEGAFSHAMALQEVERYTFRTPGQAPSYFVGYSRLMELRTDAERLLGDRFDRQAYHDFLLSQGLLSPALLRKAVMEQFVPARRIGPTPSSPRH